MVGHPRRQRDEFYIVVAGTGRYRMEDKRLRSSRTIWVVDVQATPPVLPLRLQDHIRWRLNGRGPTEKFLARLGATFSQHRRQMKLTDATFASSADWGCSARSIEQLARTALVPPTSPPDLFHIDGLAFVGEARITGDDKEPADTSARL